LIAIYILELRELSPRLLRGRSCEHHAPSRQLLMSAIDVVRRKRHVRKSADSIFVAGRREQNHLGLAARNSQFYPALFRVKRSNGSGRFVGEQEVMGRNRVCRDYVWMPCDSPEKMPRGLVR
jgi:hypothetical protein